ncbi:uncharacterized protein LOC113171870 [Anabas testudineus]|uniref:uncharacterized protein LOC113171870 n=1 Tax=Anabas testudineus TaxID=64144 RepID=UPI000E46501F|nr:uncharacterized protein LOC113171870 [Anabas testudineus]
MAAELVQDDLTLTRRVGQTVSFSCEGTDQCGAYGVYWYQKKETETFTMIVVIDLILVHHLHSFTSADTFNSRQVFVPLSVTVGGFDYPVFSSGTKLYVTASGEQVLKPVVSVYPAASRDHLEGKSSLLCVASDMFPPLVQFSWKRRKENGRLEELPSAEGEQLELRESGHTASIRTVDRDALYTYKYSCHVKHEGGTVAAQTEQVVSALPPSASVPSQYQVKLLCLLYTVLIVKSLVYCCGLSLLRILTDNGASSNYSHDDSSLNILPIANFHSPDCT